MSHHVNMSMGAVLCSAGAWAYYSKRSLPSLIASCSFGALYFASAYVDMLICSYVYTMYTLNKNNINSFISFILYIYSALIKTNTNPQLGHDIATVTSGLLVLTMGSRVIKTKSYTQPLNIATFMTVAGIGSMGYNLNKSLQYRAPVELDIDEKEIARSVTQ